MDISGISGGLLQQISNDATRSGDAVAVTLLRKAMDLHASQAVQMIQAVEQGMPDPSARTGQHVDVKV